MQDGSRAKALFLLGVGLGALLFLEFALGLGALLGGDGVAIALLEGGDQPVTCFLREAPRVE